MQEVNTADTKIPDFQRILENFNNELSRMQDNAKIILDKTCKLKEIRTPQTEFPDDSIDSNGIIGELETKLKDMTLFNGLLDEARQGLIDIIG